MNSNPKMKMTLMFCDAKIGVFVRYKSIIVMFLTSNHCFQLNESIMTKVKKSSHLNQERKKHRSNIVQIRIQAKTAQNSSKQIRVDFDVRGLQGTDFFTGESIIVDYLF